VATCGFEMARAMASMPGVEVRVLAPLRAASDLEYDRHGWFTTVRRRLPLTATRSILPLAIQETREALAWRASAILNTLWQPDGAASLMSLGFLAPAGVPYFVLAHGVEVIESHATLRKRLRASLVSVKKAVLRNARGVFSVSHFTRDLVIRECGVAPDRVRVVFNGVDPERFRPGPAPADLIARYGLAGRRVFLTVTRFDDYKGVDRTIGALRYVVARHPDVLYMICGEGQDRPRLEALVHRFGLGGHVLFTGAVAPERLVDFYNLSECFVLLSREDMVTPNFEGFGLVYLEAAACGRPSLAGRSGGIPDAVEDGVTGWLVDPSSEHEIARVMIDCLRRPDEVARRGAAARQRVLGGFTWNHMAQRVMDGMARHVRH